MDPKKPDPKKKVPDKGMDLFKKAAPTKAVAPQVTTSINEILRRLRILEERYSNIRKKIQLTEQNMLDDTKNLSDDINLIKTNIKDIKKEILEVTNKMKILNDEIDSSAQRRELNLLSKYDSLLYQFYCFRLHGFQLTQSRKRYFQLLYFLPMILYCP